MGFKFQEGKMYTMPVYFGPTGDYLHPTYLQPADIEDLAIAFNARYLVEILNHVDSPQTILEFLGPLSPAAIRPFEPSDAGEQLYVLMPLRQ